MSDRVPARYRLRVKQDGNTFTPLFLLAPARAPSSRCWPKVLAEGLVVPAT